MRELALRLGIPRAIVVNFLSFFMLRLADYIMIFVIVFIVGRSAWLGSKLFCFALIFGYPVFAMIISIGLSLKGGVSLERSLIWWFNIIAVSLIGILTGITAWYFGQKSHAK